ncbi:anti-phage dCTP deaminase [Steroidobacter agaridevorans]|uniref:anti-phage dCTP deaminase n=1 Tax=Steroidobacter agaridevorans TaxID=2695856 RepID=UPI0013799834|nr:anti-phage dCTP deaminase [Steroidobacter agaridevorans]
MSQLSALSGPELVFGLVGAVGSDLQAVTRTLTSELERVRYTVEEIHVSSLLHQLEPYVRLGNGGFESEFQRIREYMKAGTELRNRTNAGEVMALLAISAINRRRRALQSSRSQPDGAMRPLQRMAFVIRSLKHPDEILVLRHVYGRAFNVISTYSPRQDRVEKLASTIAESRGETYVDGFRAQAEHLIEIDEQEQSKLGQSVRESFPRGDFFVDASSRERMQDSLARYVRLLFGHPFETPTRDEFAMFHAYAAALRSADLGRQVGVAITNRDGSILAVGCNDVPKVGGGLYWNGESPDHRDFVKGFDSTSKFKRRLLKQALSRLREAGWMPPDGSQEDADSLIAAGTLNGTHIQNLLEFGRSVHAEMSALSEAAHRGIAVEGASMYSTTFPCHLCARHIISAGIRRVVYVEPYPKSLARELYEDMIDVDPRARRTDRVTFEPFVGVAPSIYTEMFRATERKDGQGCATTWIEGKAEARLKRFVPSYLLIEDSVLANVLPATLVRGNISRVEETSND